MAIRHITRLLGRALLPLDSEARAIYREWRAPARQPQRPSLAAMQATPDFN
ncbi:hypothetical protein BRDID11004_28540 [Bradyrhizobium diazoefficiens]|uniref:Uncharacterized protein n=1 Tax=Bradyrhizobium diazoefficiens TaxID=1355477 RepID=A0A810ATE1_9BRAD|nr:hypothetical protein F07S3_60720 [Bradyrhizobium diazoefficiens]BCA13924.1 hypothetical protein BDHF08_57710 [Bradyrhizobium diazoefficiens]BCE58334.1 hypothetical protein XF5B_58460 [Bradyrhizobium diazoefficiens]BCE67011.1 hypothetical protein XF6B_58100 [Bradyrhizobium diazoefficiens]BCE75619.1 hypothetical protein XF8B_57300 [Bradyrhizobium diazoefficiens]